MTISEMHIAFKLELDKSSALELPSFESEEIDFWLNAAIKSFVKTRYLNFEQVARRTMDLSELVEEETLAVVADTIKDNSFTANLALCSEDLWFIVGEEVTISYTKLGDTLASTKRQGVTQCTVDTYRSHIDDPHSEHILHYEEAKPLRLVYQRLVELITDGNYDVTNYYVRYIRKPIEVSGTAPLVNCDLSEHTHDEIVKLTANMVLENIEQPRYQSHTVELNKLNN